MSKPLPVLASDADAEAFIETADLTAYDLSGIVPHSLEFALRTAQANKRFQEPLLARVEAEAALHKAER